MTPQRPTPRQAAHQPAHPDARIDHVLEALRTTTPPAGLEERVAQRIAAHRAQAADARQSSTPQTRPLITTDIAADPSLFTTLLNAARNPKSLFVAIRSGARSAKSLLPAISTATRSQQSFSPVLSTGARSAQWRDPRIPLASASLYTAATALTLLIALTTIALHHRTPTTTAQSNLKPTPTQSVDATSEPAATPSLEGAGLQSRHNLPSKNPALAAKGISDRPHRQPTLDAIALAETRAPSRPAPPMPLTVQERLLMAATRPGQPILVAELDLARSPNLRAAAVAREDASIRRYVRSLLAPIAAADALTSQPQEISTTAPEPQTLSPLTN
jgi:hypothetical protein